MSLPELTQQASPWLRTPGPEGDVVISSRVRLARNIAGYPFLTRSSKTQQQEILENCKTRISETPLRQSMHWIDLAGRTTLDKQVLVERHLISRQHSTGHVPRGVAISASEDVAIMVNEEDHLRLQVLRSGMQLSAAYDQVNRLDDSLESALHFAFSSKFGYLTACPTNVGTGIRVSVMMHLPALKLTGEIEKVRRAAKDMHLAIRGFYGEGTEAIGDLFQISNQTTLGRDEQDILSDFQNTIIPQIIAYEHAARKALLDNRPAFLDDRVFRSLGLLTHARMLGTEETLYLLSYLRLGLSLGRIKGIGMPTINELYLLTQPAHLQRVAGKSLEGPQRRVFRALYIRSRLAEAQEEG